jgi:hypothetical protein
MASLSCFSKFEKKVIVDVWVGENLKLMLLTKNHSPNAGAQQYVSDVVVNEIVDEGDIYTAGGIALQNKTATPDPANGNNYFLDADDVRIGPGSTITYRFGIVYKDMGTGNHAVNTIKGQIDFLDDQVITNGVSTIRWSNLGIIYVS